MTHIKSTVKLFLSCVLIIGFAFNVKANIEILRLPENRFEENIISNTETSIDINDDAAAVITRVCLNKQQDIAIKLRELMTGLKYYVEWNEANRYIQLKNSENDIKIYVDSDYCVKNGAEIKLNNSVFIYENYSYCSKWFLEDILDVSVSKVQIGEGQRVNGVSLSAPNLPNSSRLPFPETALTVDGKPLYINYAENLKESLPYNTVFSIVDGINGSDEQVIIYSEATLKNFKISSVKYNSRTKVFRQDKTILEPGEIATPMAVLLKTTIPEGIPMEAVTFTDSKGITHSYLLGYNGKDGSVSAIAITLN